MSSYKPEVKAINDFSWRKCNPYAIAFLNFVTELEYAYSLKCAQLVYSPSISLTNLVDSKLDTDNISFESYNKKGDHYEFLEYFIREHSEDFRRIPKKVRKAGERYVQTITRGFTVEECALTVISREIELPGLFKRILESHEWWNMFGLEFYEHYLESEIALHNTPGRMENLVKNWGHQINKGQNILERFYKLRLQMYQSLSTK